MTAHDQTLVRPITPEDATTWRRAVRFGFANVDTVDDKDWAITQAQPIERCRGAFDGDRIVATYRSFPNELTLPGGALLPVGAVTAVTCQPTHRRRGVLTRMMTEDLQESRDRGEAASVLIAAEWPIYGRFGFGPAVETTRWSLDLRKASFVYGGSGEVSFASNEEFRAEAPAVFDRVRRTRPGMIDRREFVWDYLADVSRPPEEKPWKGFRLLCRDEQGVVQGYASYTIKEDWTDMVAHSQAQVGNLVGATPAAEARLIRFIAELDLVEKAVFDDVAVDTPLPHLLHDGRAAHRDYHGDFLWVRLLDVPRALEARAYDTTGSVVVEVVDDLGLAGGRFHLEAGPDGASCTPSTRTADITVPVRTLGTAYLGGPRLSALARAGWADGDATVLDRLLGTPQAPWCNTWF